MDNNDVMTKVGFNRLIESSNTPTLSHAGTRAVEAWFLGTKAENAEEFERLIVEAIRDHVFWRRNYYPGDPTHITEAVKQTPDYIYAISELREGFRSLLAFLKKSTPFFSMRYQGHMIWDLTLPGMAGYFAAMLYNPNNVAFEASPATTILEMLVGDDLCRMLGYEIPSEAQQEKGAIRPWGHITCDGSVANIEAIWAARNLKFYPLALKQAIASDKNLAAARELSVSHPSGEVKRLLEMDRWQLLNLPIDELLSLPGKLKNQFNIELNTLSKAIEVFSLQNLGWLSFSRMFLADLPEPVIMVPGTRHYSFPKATSLLGLGSNHLISIPADLDARQDIKALKAKLEQCLAERRPVIAVVAVTGTTDESAVDPLVEILKLRDEFAARGLMFHVHIDAAWGGYHRSLINDEFDLPLPTGFRAPPLAVPLSHYVEQQYRAFGQADSITVDPHKSGYIPYPAGALCYRNAAMRDLITFSAPVVFHGEADKTVGIFGIEGSKPGAAAAAVYLSHRVIRPTKSGYGKIIGEALFSCRKLYVRLLTMGGQKEGFTVVPLPRLPSERRNENTLDEVKRIVELIDRRTDEEIQNNSEALNLIKEIGPDQNILAYAFNFYQENGDLNSDLDAMNRLNKTIYEQLSIKVGDDIYGYSMIVSSTDLNGDEYGSDFIEHYKRRLGISDPGQMIKVIRSVVMDPWITETAHGSFIDVLEEELKKAVLNALNSIREEDKKKTTAGH